MQIQPAHDHAAITICATNYLGKALALRESYIALHPASDFYILIVDKKHDRLRDLPADIRILWVEELGIDNFYSYAMKFDVIELSTAIKPSALSALLAHYRAVLYIDPDIYFYADLNPVLEILKSRSIAVTPHTLSPIVDDKVPSDVDFLRMGSFNLGFIGVANCEEAFRFLDWWSKRCLQFGFYEPQSGLAVDQKWVDLSPALFPGLEILRDPGLNVAFWNLHERSISNQDGAWTVNGRYPLRFFHFSSFTAGNPHAIAQKQSRFAPGSRPDLHELLDAYAERLRQNESESYSKYKYSFNYFEDGLCVTPSLRRFYAALEMHFPVGENPFSRGSNLQRFAIAKGLAGKKHVLSKQPTFKELGEYGRSTRAFGLGLRVALRICGPNRYFSLMRYMAHMSSIRNQSEIFGRKA